MGWATIKGMGLSLIGGPHNNEYAIIWVALIMNGPSFMSVPLILGGPFLIVAPSSYRWPLLFDGPSLNSGPFIIGWATPNRRVYPLWGGPPIG